MSSSDLSLCDAIEAKCCGLMALQFSDGSGTGVRLAVEAVLVELTKFNGKRYVVDMNGMRLVASEE